MTHRISWLSAALTAVCCLWLASPGWALAAEVRSGPSALVAPGETVDDDLFAGGGQSVTISGHVTGDAYAVAETVIVTGSIDGDLIAAAQQVTVDGSVGGNVRAAGANVTVNGSVGHSVTGLAQHISLSSNGRVAGSVVALGQSIDAFGSVGRGMTVGGSTLQLAGPVGGPVKAWVETLSIAPTAQLASSLEYQAKQEAVIPAGTVGGEVHFAAAPAQQPRPEPLLNGLFDLGGLIGLFGSFVLGALTIVLMPRASARAAEIGRQQPWQSFGLGLIILIGVPIAGLLVAITLIGIPIALSVFALYVVGIMLAWPAVALVLGMQLSRLISRDRPLPVLGALAVGLIVLHLASHLPAVGGLIAFCAVVFGLGMLAQTLRHWRRPLEQPFVAPPLAAAAA